VDTQPQPPAASRHAAFRLGTLSFCNAVGPRDSSKAASCTSFLGRAHLDPAIRRCETQHLSPQASPFVRSSPRGKDGLWRCSPRNGRESNWELKSTRKPVLLTRHIFQFQGVRMR